METRDPLPESLQMETYRLRNIVGLAAFATEARRVLREIDMLANQMPHLSEALAFIKDRRQWSEYPDTAPQVLDDVQERLANFLRDT